MTPEWQIVQDSIDTYRAYWNRCERSADASMFAIDRIVVIGKHMPRYPLGCQKKVNVLKFLGVARREDNRCVLFERHILEIQPSAYTLNIPRMIDAAGYLHFPDCMTGLGDSAATGLNYNAVRCIHGLRHDHIDPLFFAQNAVSMK